MQTYARVENGVVAEIIRPMQYDADSPEGVTPTWKNGDEIPIERRYSSPLIDGEISLMVNITNVTPEPTNNWGYDGTVFSPPQSAK